MRRETTSEEAIVRKDEAELSTPNLDEIPSGTEEIKGKKNRGAADC